MAHADGFIPYDPPRLEPEEALARARAFRESLGGRRSVRDFSTRPVDPELIEEAVRAAGLAPNGANMQPWTFVLVTDPELKAKIREAAEAEERETYANRMSDEWRAALAPLGTNWEKPHLTDAPALLVVFEQAYGVAPDGSKVTHYYVKESVGIAAGFLIAALHQAGLATLTHTPSPMGFLRELLGRPVNERAFVLLPVGYPAEGCTVPRITKKGLDEILVRR
ncbi:MAG: nitroreductase family protein [Candidatus Sumerlaeia bacterium]|nr:nitroreductase family protein [Candidatus Sumerlaeia bacterium]